MTDFFDAILNSNVKRVKLLLSDPNIDPSENDNEAIQKASRNGQFEIVKLLLSDSRVDPSANDNYPLKWAALLGDFEIVKLLLSDPRVDPSEEDNFALMWAGINGHIEIVKLLLSDPRVDPSVGDNQAIREASNHGRYEIVKLLLSDPRVDPSVRNNESIILAALNGNYETVKVLLSDPRVDWKALDKLANKKIKNRLIEDANLELKDEIKTSLLAINRVTPKMKIQDEQEKNLIPKTIRKNIIYRAPYEELCSIIKGEIPPIKLIALANLLKIEYDANISWKELCGKVKINLLQML